MRNELCRTANSKILRLLRDQSRSIEYMFARDTDASPYFEYLENPYAHCFNSNLSP